MSSLEEKYPHIAEQWHPYKNSFATDTVAAHSRKSAWWIQQKITVPEYSGKEFIGEELFGRALSSQKNSMLKFKVSEEFDWERNHPLTPGGLSEWSKDKVWWKCSMCGKGWNCTVSHRIKKLNDRLGCADCRGGAR